MESAQLVTKSSPQSARFQAAQKLSYNKNPGTPNRDLGSTRFQNALRAPQNAGVSADIMARRGIQPSTIPTAGQFTVNSPQVIPSTALTSSVTTGDLLQKRQQMEATSLASQQSQASLDNALGTAEGVASSQSKLDPDAFVRSLVFNPEVGQVEGQQKASVGKLESLLPSLFGKGKRQMELENASGVPQMQQELQKINLQLAQAKAAYDKAAVGIVNEAGQTVVGAESRLNPLARQQAADLGALSAISEAYQGNIELAMDIAERTVALEYGDVEQAINNELTMLEARTPLLEGEEKKRAEKVALALELRKEKVTQEKADRDSVMALTLEAAKNGAPANLVASASKMADPFKAISILSSYMSDPQDRLIKSLQIKKLQQEASTIAGSITPEAKTSMLSTVNLVNRLLMNPNLSGISGIQVKSFIPGTEEKALVTQYEQLKGLLALENRQKLKGSGAISDFEAKTLERAASALSRATSDEAFRKELINVKGALSSASGIPVKVRISNGNASQVLQATRNGIEAAISDGAVVEYLE